MELFRLMAVVACACVAVPAVLSAQVNVGPQQFEVGVFIDLTPDVTPPSVPSGVSATAISAIPQISVSWNASTDDQNMSYYNVYRDNALYASTTLTSYPDTSIFYDVTYAYTVSAVDLTGNESARSATVTALVTDTGGGGGASDNTPPTIPDNVGALVDLNIPEVALSWDPSTDAGSGMDRYRVYRDGVFRASVSVGTTYQDITVVLGNTYIYTVSAVDRAGNESDESDPLLVDVSLPPDTTPPTVPANLSVDLITSAPPSVSLSWDVATDTESTIGGYRLFRNGVLIADSATTTYTDTTVLNNTSYSYRVSAYDSEGNQSAQSAAVVANVPVAPDTTAPSVPTNLARTINTTAPSVTLTWSASTDSGGSGLAGYRVFRGGVQIATTTGLTYLDTAVTFNTTYTYRVAAFDAAGNQSAQTAPVTAPIPAPPPPPDTTPPSVPAGLSGIPDGDVPSVALSWNASTDAGSGVASYNLFRNGTFLTSVSGLSFVDTTVAQGTSYLYRVSAVDGVGNESARSDAITINVPAPPPPDPDDDEDDTGGGGGGGIIVIPDDDTVTPTPTPGTTTDNVPIEPGNEPGEIDEPVERPRATTSLPRVPDVVRDTAENIGARIRETAEEVDRIVPEDPGRQRIITVGSAVTGVVAPAIQIAVAPALSGASFWYVLLSRVGDIGQLFAWLFPWLGIRKRRKPWGTVYDSISKQPLDPAYVELINAETNEAVTSAITDLDGRFGFTAPPGTYRIKAQKTNYVFPSRRLIGKSDDAIYEHLYFGEELTVSGEGEEQSVLIHDIPMDPEKFDWNEFEKRRLGVMTFYSRYDLIIHYLSAVLFYFGLSFAVFVLILNPTLFNGIILSIYAIVIILRLAFMKPRTNGTVIEKDTGAPLAYAAIKVFIPGQERPAKKVVTDHMGRYYCLVRPGTYQVVIEAQTEDGQYLPIFRTEEMTIKKGVIDTKFEV